MSTNATFGQWLRQRRKALDFTREELAQRIGCAATTLYKIEANERRPSKQLAALLAEHLNISPNERPGFVRFARAEPAESNTPWGTPFHPRNNLPAQPTVLIGRDADVQAVRKRLLQPEARLLTLVGPPGIGKTRLALEVAAHILDDFTDGVFLVPLAPITDANLVLTTIATTLGILDAGPQTPLERLKVFLRDKEMLLVLDNFEQILAAAAHLSELLTTCPWLKLLVTSRAPLRIRHERQIPVSALSVPDLVRLPDFESVSQYTAVTLFIERTKAVKPDFTLTPENVPIIAAICARLDGLPLAIELISSRIKLLSPAALLERLSGRLLMHSDGLRDIEPRHRTLNAAIDWSYQLLNAEEQALFRRLGVFVGGWTLEAAEAVCMERLSLNVLEGLASLLDKNLMKQETSSESEPRFTMLETIREYALERLASSGEMDNLRTRHAEYFTAFAEHAEPNHARWLNKLETEQENFRAALTSRETGLRLPVVLSLFWQQRGHLTEGSRWLTNALSRQEPETLTSADRRFQAMALDWLGVFTIFQGDLETAQPHLEGSLVLFRELGDRGGLANTLGNYAMLFVLRGDYEPAGPLLAEGLALSHELRNTYLIAQCLHFLGDLAYSQGQIQRAGMFWEESLTLCRTDDKQWAIAILLTFLSMVALEQCDVARAKDQLIESLTLLQELGDRWQTAHTLEVFACLAVMRKYPIRAAHIFGAAEVLREIVSAPVLLFQRQFNERCVANLHTQLDETALMSAWREGRAMTLDQAIAYALSEG